MENKEIAFVDTDNLEHQTIKKLVLTDINNRLDHLDVSWQMDRGEIEKEIYRFMRQGEYRQMYKAVEEHKRVNAKIQAMTKVLNETGFDLVVVDDRIYELKTENKRDLAINNF